MPSFHSVRLWQECSAVEYPQSSFIFIACRAGSEPALKREIARRHPGLLTPAFMRPQLLTFKASRPLSADFDPQCVFARAWGISLARVPADAPGGDWISQLPKDLPLRVHAFPRIAPETGVTEADLAAAEAIGTGVASLLSADPARQVSCSGPALDGEFVIDVITGEEGEPALIGCHLHRAPHHPLPGALPLLVQPDAAPSRAWRKVEEAFAFAGWAAPGFLEGRTALELGCAPGGASYALLNRGVRVIGVDPGPVEDRVLHFQGPAGATLTHLRLPAGALAGMELPSPIDLLLSDMNLAPPVVLRYIERLQQRIHAPALILTLKLNDADMESQVPDFLAQLKRFAPRPLLATPLPSNRREICVIAGALKG